MSRNEVLNLFAPVGPNINHLFFDILQLIENKITSFIPVGTTGVSGLIDILERKVTPVQVVRGLYSRIKLGFG